MIFAVVFVEKCDFISSKICYNSYTLINAKENYLCINKIIMLDSKLNHAMQGKN